MLQYLGHSCSFGSDDRRVGCGFFMFLRSPLILDQALLCESVQGLLPGRLVASVVLGLLSGKRGEGMRRIEEPSEKLEWNSCYMVVSLKGIPTAMGFNIKKV